MPVSEAAIPIVTKSESATQIHAFNIYTNSNVWTLNSNINSAAKTSTECGLSENCFTTEELCRLLTHVQLVPNSQSL